MENIVIKIEADTSGVQSTIEMLKKMGVVSDQVFDAYTKNVEKNSQAIKKSADSSAQSFDKLNRSIESIKTDNNLAKNLDASQAIVKTGNSLASLRSQLKEATQQAQLFADKYGELDKRTIAAARSASELRRKIEDTGRVIKALDPGERFNTIKNFASSIGGLFQVATGSLQAFGIESEKAQKIAQQFQGALNIFQGLQSIAELNDSFVALKAALGLSTVATEVQAAAMTGEAAAATGAAAANETFAVSLSATGIGAIVVVLGTLVGAMIAYSNSVEDASRSTKILNDARDKAVDSVATEATKLKILVDEYQKAGTSQQKRKEISKEMISIAPQLAGAFDKEGKAIGDLTTKTNDLITAKLLQAEADAIVAEVGKINAENAKLRAKGVKEELSFWDLLKNTAIQTAKSGGLAAFWKGSEIAAATTADAAERLNDKLSENEKTAKALTGRLEELRKAGVKFGEDVNKAAGGEDKKSPFELAVEKIKTNGEKVRAEQQKLYGDIFLKDPELFALSTAQAKEKELKQLLEVYKKFGKDASPILAELEGLQKTLDIKPVEKNIDINLLFPDPDQQDQFEYLINPNLVPTRKTENIKVHVETDEELAIQKTKEALKKQLGDEIVSGAKQVANEWIGVWVDAQLEVDKKRIESIDQENSDLKTQYDNKLIGKMEYDAKVSQLDEKKRAAERQLKMDQARAEREKALFEIAINTAAAVVKALVDSAGTLIPLYLAIGAAQAAAVMAAPMPRYKKGTLSVPGIGSEDTQMALLTPGEAVIPKETNHRYKESISAIYHGKISPNDLNTFVRMKLKGDFSENASGPVTAKMDTADLYALGKMMRKSDGVYIKNVGELAGVFASLNNPRR